MSEANEFEIIRRYFSPLAILEQGALGLADDAAVLDLAAGKRLVVTTDMLVAGVHFFPGDPADSIGQKSLAVNLSDLAAMGAEPRAYVLAVALPSNWPRSQAEAWLCDFAQGLASIQHTFRLSLVGGDTVATPGPLSLSLTAFGSVEQGRELRRSGAQPGDVIWVSGRVGDGVLGLKVLSGEIANLEPVLARSVIEHYRRPFPRVSLGRNLVGLAHACIDISDGLIADLGHVCRASKVTAIVESALIPLSKAGQSAARAHSELPIMLLTGGDDYELLFTAPEAKNGKIRQAGAAAGVEVTPIGKILDFHKRNNLVTLVNPGGEAIEAPINGWRHF